MSQALVRGITVGILLSLAMPLIVTPQTIGPFVVGKALYVRVVIEVVAAACLVLITLDRSYRPPRSRVLLALVLYTVVLLGAGLTGVSPSHSFWSDYQRMTGGWDALHWLALVVVMATVLRTPRQWTTVIAGYVAIAGVLTLLALSQVYLRLDSAYLAGGPRVGATTGNPTYLAAMLVIAAILLAGRIAQRTAPRPPDAGAQPWRGTLTVLGIIATAAMVWTVLRTGSRGPFVALLGGAGVQAISGFWQAPPTRRWYGASAGTALMVLTLGLATVDLAAGLRSAPEGAGSVSVAQRALDPLADRSIHVRWRLWQIGLEGFRQRPALGWGTGNYSRIFDRHADPAFYTLTWFNADSPHNKPVEELATKGVAGGLAYALLWGILGFALLTRVRPADRFQALAVLGALAALFVHDLAFFDTPGTMLGFAILVAWAAAHEWPLREPRRGGPEVEAGSRLLPAACAALAIAGLAIVIARVHLPMYRGASQARTALIGALPVEQRTRLAAQSFDGFPPMAPYLRRLVFVQFAVDLPSVSATEQETIIAFAHDRGPESMDSDPGDARLLMTVLPMMQAVSASASDLERLEPYIRRLRELAPNRIQTHQILATQALERGDYDEAIRIVDAFEARIPGQVPSFYVIRERALHDQPVR